jgi:hypothetical protein
VIISARWISLITFVILILIITIKGQGTWKEKIKKYGIAFVEGMVGGIIIDSIGINAGYYYFPRQPIYSFEYYSIVLPCWGLFGLLINYLWESIGQNKFGKGLAVTLFPMFLFYEGYNLYTGSWVYTTPIFVVGLGWIPLILVFAGCNRRRKVVFKLEQWMIKTENRLVFKTLSVCRYLIIIVMFPLLFTRLAKLLISIKELRSMGFKLGDYAEYLMVAE